MQTITLWTPGVVRDGADRDAAGVDAELERGGVHVGEQARAEAGIDPGAGDEPGAVGGAAAVDELQRPAQLVGREHALGLQQVGHGLGQRHVPGERRVLEVLPGCG